MISPHACCPRCFTERRLPVVEMGEEVREMAADKDFAGVLLAPWICLQRLSVAFAVLCSSLDWGYSAVSRNDWKKSSTSVLFSSPFGAMTTTWYSRLPTMYTRCRSTISCPF